MKKKLKLKRWVKVLISVIVVVAGILIYSKLRDIGSINNQFTLTICLLGWFYVLVGQVAILIGLWEL